jgi:DNA-binding response OmpR family regulator
MRLLIVEDDAELVNYLKAELERAGFAVDAIDNGIDGEFMGSEESYDVIVLDLGLPGKSGLEVLRHWRSADNGVPVIVLTGRDAWHDRVDGFKAGADDYLGKPFHVEELLARVHALIRRSQTNTQGPLQVAGLELDEDTQTVTTANGKRYALTGTEFKLLRYFMLHSGKLLSKSQLTEHVYEFDSDKDSNVLEVYVNRLRRKLGRSLIETRRGQGYVFGNDR